MSLSISSNQRNGAPAPVGRIADVMAGYTRPWCICGGWAVEAWLGGGEMREHGDVDVAVFVHDQRALFEHLRGWQLVAHDRNVPGNTSELWDGKRQIDLPGHIHGRLHPGDDVPVNLDTPGEQGVRLSREELVERVLARDQDRQSAPAASRSSPLLSQGRDSPREAD